MSDLDDYDYELPRDLIAQQPLRRRADARLLVADRRSGELDHRYVRDLPELLRPGDCLVLNDTRVVPARLVGTRNSTGGRWEGLFLRLDDAGRWLLLCKTRGKLRAGETVTVLTERTDRDLRLLLAEPLGDGQWAAVPDTQDDALAVLERVGRVPLPPYIRGGEMVASDRQQYQTVYARRPGAVAAPTAGLHFTEALLARLESVGVELCRTTLHVGLDTFRPVKTALAEHVMHSEWGSLGEVAAAQIRRCRQRGGRIVAVGTTVVRVLETAAAEGELRPWCGWTRLFIRPPYRFRAVDALLTNFHLPRTTLLVLVRTFGGDELIRRGYAEAIAEEYRFYSYGDAMLIV